MTKELLFLINGASRLLIFGLEILLDTDYDSLFLTAIRFLTNMEDHLSTLTRTPRNLLGQAENDIDFCHGSEYTISNFVKCCVEDLTGEIWD